MKKLFISAILVILLAGFVSANVCTGVPGCEGATSPRNYPFFWSNPPNQCDWMDPYSTFLYFDECRAGGDWFYFGPDDAGILDGYVCYYCDELGRDCSVVRDILAGTSSVVCYNCHCADYLSGFPAPPCAPLTGDDCVDEKCCVSDDSFTDYRDGMTYTGNHGKYVSCVAQARKECGIIPSKDDTDVQKSAAKSITGKAVDDLSVAMPNIVAITAIAGLVAVSITAFNKLKK